MGNIIYISWEYYLYTVPFLKKQIYISIQVQVMKFCNIIKESWFYH